MADASAPTRVRAIKRLLGDKGFDNFNRIVASMADKVPARLHDAWYLSILGVHPEAQGTGTARELLAPTRRRADDLGIPCFLETFNPSSLSFYERTGFRETIPCVEEVTDRPYWIIIRQPLAGHVAQDDSNLMRHFRRAGLVTIGRTTSPEMAFSTTTESVHNGPTRNPWDLGRSAGGRDRVVRPEANTRTGVERAWHG